MNAQQVVDQDCRKKLSQFADCVHHAIPYSEIEKSVISTTLFNRLHNVLQNSTLYLTYPCNRTSRFSHSLGAMHLGGEIFRYGVANSRPSDVIRFLGAVKDEIIALQQTPAFKSSVKPIKRDANDKLNQLNPWQLDDHLYTLATPALLLPSDKGLVPLTEEQRYCYLVAYQSIRLVALLHDLGHPPFSHVTEDALTSLAARLSAFDTADITREAKERVGEFENLLLQYMEAAAVAKPSFHESLGAKLCLALLDRIISNLLDEATSHRGQLVDQALKKRAYDLAVISNFVAAVFDSDANRKPLFIGLHAIVDSDLDCDRLDYVIRDLLSSGIYRDTIQYDRLITSYSIWFDDDKVPHFLPSTRALSTIEDFFWQRLFLYRYVVYHHRVIKMDGLLRETLAELGFRYLLAEPPFESEPAAPIGTSDHLIPHVSGLWRILGQDPDYIARLEAQFSQWDDSWLLAVLRQHYFCDRDSLNEETVSKLNELLANEKCYISIIKRADSFVPIETAFLERARTEPNLFKASRLALTGTGIQPPAEFVAIEKLFASDIIQSGALPGEQGFLIGRLLSVLSLKIARFSATQLLFETAESFRLESPKRELFIVRRALKPGIAKAPFRLISGDGSPIDIDSVSKLNEDLRRTVTVFPPFFVYIRRRNEGFDGTQLRSVIGDRLFETFKNLVTKDKDENTHS